MRMLGDLEPSQDSDDADASRQPGTWLTSGQPMAHGVLSTLAEDLKSAPEKEVEKKVTNIAAAYFVLTKR